MRIFKIVVGLGILAALAIAGFLLWIFSSSSPEIIRTPKLKYSDVEKSFSTLGLQFPTNAQFVYLESVPSLTSNWKLLKFSSNTNATRHFLETNSFLESEFRTATTNDFPNGPLAAAWDAPKKIGSLKFLNAKKSDAFESKYPWFVQVYLDDSQPENWTIYLNCVQPYN